MEVNATARALRVRQFGRIDTGRLSLSVLWGSSVLAAVAFVAVYLYWDRGYIWLDEVFSLWATEKTRSVVDMQTQLLANETNPPLHFWLLYAFRRLINDPRLAGHALNFVVAALSLTAIVGLPWRSGRPRLGLLLGIVYLMSGSSMSFMQDIRNGFTALSLCGVAVALSGTVRLKAEADRTDLLIAVGLGLLAGISHVYGALFTGSLSAAMIIEGMYRKSRSQALFGLALGGACSLTFAAWFAGLLLSTQGHLVSIAWLARIPPLLGFDNVWRSYFGPAWAWYLMGLGFVIALGSALFRRSAIFLLICAVMVFGIPVLTSLKTPIVFFRYFLILAPPLHMLLALAVYDLVGGYGRTEPRGGLSTATMVAGCIALAVPVLTGVSNANFLVPHQDPWWLGVDRVRAEAGNCPSHVIRADMSQVGDLADGMKWGFTYLLRGTGLQLEDMAKTTKDVSDIDCRVVGWSEHMITSRAGMVPGEPTEDDALKLTNLTNKRHVPLKIERHFLGFVIYKANP